MNKKKYIKLAAGLAAAMLFITVLTTSIQNYLYLLKHNEMKSSGKLHFPIQAAVAHELLQKDGYNIHYFTSGPRDKELLLFLHPAFADHRCFDRQIDFFSEKYRVISIDLLGHGLSQPENTKDKIDASIEHIEEIMEKEGFVKAHIVGVSMGSLLAQYFALQHPDQVSSLTVLGGYNIHEEHKKVISAQRREMLKWAFKAIFSMNSFRRYGATSSASNPEEQARLFEMTSLFTRKSFRVMSGLGNVIKNRPDFQRSYPLLVLNGDKDVPLAKEVAGYWHKKETGSQFQLISNAGHCANMDNAEEFNRILLSFLQESHENKTAERKNEK